MKSKIFDDNFDIKKEILSTVDDLKANLPAFMKETVTNQFKKDGIVIGVSGGVDSALIATLAVEALGASHVYGLILPEKESNPSTDRELALHYCKKLKIPFGEVPITPMVEAFGIYAQKELLLENFFPQYDPAVHTTNLFLPPGYFRKPACIAFYQALHEERVDRSKTPVRPAISETHQSPERKTKNTNDCSLHAGGKNELRGERNDQ